jgi:hypothetical protein
MFKSLGNILLNADVGMLFIAMHGKPKRLRVNGRATVNYDDPLLVEIVGAQLIVRVTARHDSSELPALHSNHAVRRALDLYAARRLRAAGAGMEGLR